MAPYPQIYITKSNSFHILHQYAMYKIITETIYVSKPVSERKRTIVS